MSTGYEMKLTDGEKLIAYMLADLMERLGVESEIDPDLVKEAIAGDDLWALKWKYDSLFHNDGPSKGVVSETADIMTMCRVLETSIAHLEEEELGAIPEDKRQVFEGFDGNEEPHYGVATMLVEKLDRFTEWRDRPLNSHAPMLRRYRAMFRAYKGRELPMKGVFGLNDIQTIINAPAVEGMGRNG